MIAAYQASQIMYFVTVGQTYAMLLGGDQVRKIRNEPLRDSIIAMLNFDYDVIGRQAVLTRYRDDVRAVIPDSIQSAVRKHCGDLITRSGEPRLPPTCDIPLPPMVAAAGAKLLRAHPELIAELRQHHATDFDLSLQCRYVGNAAEKCSGRAEADRAVSFRRLSELMSAFHP